MDPQTQKPAGRFLKHANLWTPGDVVRLSGLSSSQYNDKIAKVVSHKKGDARALVQVLPLGPSIRVLRERMSFPARCRLCHERIHGVTCGACFTPADHIAPANSDVDPSASSWPPSPACGAKRSRSSSASPRGSQHVLVDVLPAAARPRRAAAASRTRLSEAELDARVAAALWMT